MKRFSVYLSDIMPKGKNAFNWDIISVIAEGEKKMSEFSAILTFLYLFQRSDEKPPIISSLQERSGPEAFVPEGSCLQVGLGNP
jgi:hypothetical protein